MEHITTTLLQGNRRTGLYIINNAPITCIYEWDDLIAITQDIKTFQEYKATECDETMDDLTMGDNYEDYLNNVIREKINQGIYVELKVTHLPNARGLR